jgi:hypothetical protein
VDVTNREAAIAERLEKERETMKDKANHPMTRTTSQQRSQRDGHPMSRSSSHAGEARSTGPPSSRSFNASAATVRPAVSFAKAASNQDISAPEESVPGPSDVQDDSTAGVTEQLGETTI